MSNNAPSRADPVVVFPLGRWCPPQETSQPHPPPCIRKENIVCICSYIFTLLFRRRPHYIWTTNMAAWLYLAYESFHDILFLISLGRSNPLCWEQHGNSFFIHWQTLQRSNKCLNEIVKHTKLQKIGNKAVEYTGSYFTVVCLRVLALQWRHNGRVGVSNHQYHNCFLNCLFRRRSKDHIKTLRRWPLWGEFTGDRWIPRTKGQ